ncbi:MAG: hypothetical protein HeimC3_49430 [Candidatus Heimdallarchaeota archaeon LC_3]|nr:MAG: hypothetical protein HeimC3_49430 [Candidatus Heimdallarchaeota archaeon LC_3]
MKCFSIKPHFFASLYGSMVATGEISHGKVLSERDMFSSEKFYKKLSQMYNPWKNNSDYSISGPIKNSISNAIGLFIPWMNTLAGKLSPENRNINDVKSLFKDLLHHLKQKEFAYSYLSNGWDGIILDFQLRLGSNPLTITEDLLAPVIDFMADYQENFYNEFWTTNEFNYYNILIKSILDSNYKINLNKGIELLNKWILGSSPKTPVLICLNRFLGSIDPEINYNAGYGLHGSPAIHVAPKLIESLNSLLHEVFHSLIYESNPFQRRKEVIRMGDQIGSYFKDEESPIPFWTWEELYTHEIEEIFADFVAGVAYKEIFPKKEFRSSYADSDEFLKPIYERLIENTQLLKEKGLDKLIESSFKNWKYKK